MNEVDDQGIVDFAAALLLRYLRRGENVSVAQPIVEVRRDLAMLRLHWVMSSSVNEFLDYLLANKHQTQSLLEYHKRIDDGVAHGSLDARATVLLQTVTGHPSILVSKAPMRSFNTGPNQIVAWVVDRATNYATELFSKAIADSNYGDLIEKVMLKLAAVRRIKRLREPLMGVSHSKRPSAGAVRDAFRSRQPLYRKAVIAYDMLRRLEQGDPDALRDVLASTLFAPLEPWRRFELAIALAVGVVISEETGIPLDLAVLTARNNASVMQCGQYAIYWQQATSNFKRPQLEPSEVMLKDALHAYGLSLSTERPDVLIIDEDAGQVKAIVEVKYVAGDSGPSRFREAVGQIVRYARCYARESAGIEELIRKSLVALTIDAPVRGDNEMVAPSALDFRSLKTGSLRGWVRQHFLDRREA